MMLVLTLSLLSPAFGFGERIPVLYTADGGDISPPLVWVSDFKAGSYALICVDPDAPSGEWVHWVVYNIPAGSMFGSLVMNTRTPLWSVSPPVITRS